ncbi:MAG: hypothetical protein A2Y25_03005 [Candidatus Melainabacteria bacterium GWF2_37_15]|nr:MAG: hypothetical protein A2Y25_03005 [Candidatus Melainabacteria bacterium GWF2_37_15]
MELKQKYGENLYNPNILEFKNVPKDILHWLEKISLENNCRIEKKEWRSKYNSYVVYDYEPFCSDGFEISLTISSTTRNYLKFIQYLYENKLKNIEYLENCLIG